MYLFKYCLNIVQNKKREPPTEQNSAHKTGVVADLVSWRCDFSFGIAFS